MKFFKRFGVRLNLSILSVHLFATVFMYVIALGILNSGIQASFIDQIRTTAGFVASQIGVVHIQDNPEDLELLLGELLLTGNITYATVVNNRQQVIYSSNEAWNKKFQEDFSFDSGGDDNYNIAVPIFNNSGDHVGAIKLGFSEDIVREDLDKISETTLIIGLVYLIVVAIVIVFIASRLTKPLDNLRLMAKEVVRHHDKQLQTSSDICEIVDLTSSLEDMRRQLVLRQQSLVDKEYYSSTIINNMADAMLTYDESGHIIRANKLVESIFGIKVELLCSMNITDLIQCPLQSLCLNDINSSVNDNNLDKSAIIQEAVALKIGSGSINIEYAISKISIENRIVFIVLIRDVTEKIRVTDELIRMANYDTLTGLPNRNMFLQLLRAEMIVTVNSETLLSVMFIDLDGFKKVNDSLGHSAGDKLLKEVAKRIKLILSSSDTVGRLGGDEFVIILRGCNTLEIPTRTAQRLIATLQNSIVVHNQEVIISPSIGISIYPLDQNSADNILVEADIAMYRAKELGGNRYEFYTREMNIHTIARLNLETRLRQALERKEFELYYQPQIALDVNKVIGLEALIRWNKGKFEMVPPDEFISILEETGLMIDVGSWVIETATKQSASWLKQYDKVPRIAINISARQFDTNTLPKTIEYHLDLHQLPPEQLEIEITESAIMKNMSNTTEQLNDIYQMGVEIALDDFGTGHSSLAHLKKYPIDIIKIDRSFIRNVCESESDQALVRAILAMAKALNKKTLAEGVETLQQKDWLQAHQCNLIQGYYYAKPMNVVEVAKFFSTYPDNHQ